MKQGFRFGGNKAYLFFQAVFCKIVNRPSAALNLKPQQLIILLPLIIGCEAKIQNHLGTKNNEALAENYTRYKKEGLSLVYPPHWKLAYDEPGVRADREVIFDTPKDSRITVMIFNNETITSQAVADTVIKDLGLKTEKRISDFKRDQITLPTTTGVKLSWKESFIMEISVELLILQSTVNGASVFVQYLFFDEDIEAENKHILPFFHGLSFTSPAYTEPLSDQ